MSQDNPKVIPITRAAARAFMALPPEERTRILMGLVPISFSVGEEKRPGPPGEMAPAKEPHLE